jgi:hypothetical protein
MRRRRALLVSFVASAFAAAGACGFPEVSFQTGADGSTPEGGDAPSQIDKDAAKDATDELPPDVDPNGKNEDASTRGDADTKVDAAGCTTCDCDTDNFFRRDAGCNGGPGAVYDCDDTDTFISPNQSWVTDPVWPSTAHAIPFDWNCSGAVEKQYFYGVRCTLLANCAAEGFSGNPACGEEGDYIFCKDSLILGLACEEDVPKRKRRVQGCK